MQKCQRKTIKKRVKHCIFAVPNQSESRVKPKTFQNRIVYNSNFKRLHTENANINISKNINVFGENKHVNIPESVKVNETCTTPKQRCNNVQGECYNVSTMNRFDTLHVGDNLHMDIEEKAVSDKYC